MKFKIAVNDLQYAMRLVKDVLPTTAPLAENCGVRIKALPDRAVFTAFSPSLLTQVVVKIDGAEEGEAVVSAAALHSAISRFQAENDNGVGTSPITVSATPKSKKLTIAATTTYTSGVITPHKRSFPLLNQELLPNIKEPIAPSEKDLTLPGAVFMDGIDCVAYALSTDKSNALFTGVLFKAIPGEGLLFVGSNGICLAEYRAPMNYSGAPITAVIPGHLASKISRSFFDDDNLSVSVEKRRLIVRTENLIVSGALINEDYPDYAAMVPEPKNSVLVSREILSDNLLNLNYEASGVEDGRVALVLEGGSMALICGGSENSGIKMEGFAGLLKFEANLKLLTMSMRNLTGSQIRLGFTDDKSPMHISSVDKFASGATLRCIVVPLT